MIRDSLEELVDLLWDEPHPLRFLQRALRTALHDPEIDVGDAAAATSAAVLIATSLGYYVVGSTRVREWCDRIKDNQKIRDLLPEAHQVFEMVFTGDGGWCAVRTSSQFVTLHAGLSETRELIAADVGSTRDPQ